MDSLNITAATVVSALGKGRTALRAGVRGSSTPLHRTGFAGLDLPVGEVAGVDDVTLGKPWWRYDCRNNRLAEMALASDDFEHRVGQAVARHGRHAVGLFVGTSTAGMRETEQAFRALSSGRTALPPDFPYNECHRIFAPADFLARRLSLRGHTVSLSTACSSSAKAFAAAARSIRLGLCDAAVVGGVDSLCYTTVHGFTALQLTAPTPCRPFAPDRDGLCVGEAAALALLERAPRTDTPRLLGYGESSDAHHMSTPHPDALGARLAIRRALHRAGIPAAAVDYINLHGTATRVNDSTEDHAVSTEVGPATPCSSTKGWTGHTLGAAGIIEAIVCLDVLETGFMPATQNTPRIDPTFRSNVLTESCQQAANVALSNSFGFGGSNCALLFGAA